MLNRMTPEGERNLTLFDRYTKLMRGDVFAAYHFFNMMHPQAYKEKASFALIQKRYRKATAL